MTTKALRLTKSIALALAAALVAAPALAAGKEAGGDKCYGIAKKGRNDCAARTGGHACTGREGLGGHGCAGLSTVDNAGTDFKLIANGTCVRIGGHLSPS